jgi:hypothetical protein
VLIVANTEEPAVMVDEDRDQAMAETSFTAKLLEDWLAAEEPLEDFDFTVPPKAPQELARYIAGLIGEKDIASATRADVEEAQHEDDKLSEATDVGTYVQLVVGGGMRRAWTFKFPVNFAFRYLRVLAIIWLRSIEARYKKAVGITDV